MGRPRRDRAVTAGALPAQRAPVGMGRDVRRVAEDVLEAADPGAPAVQRRSEHMFVRLGKGSDGTKLLARRGLAPAATFLPPTPAATSLSGDPGGELAAVIARLWAGPDQVLLALAERPDHDREMLVEVDAQILGAAP